MSEAGSAVLRPGGSLRLTLLLALAGLGTCYVAVLLRDLLARHREGGRVRPLVLLPSWRETATGFITTFFDTFGIGSFATTTALFRAWHLVPDERIPGTLNVGHSLAAVLAAFIFIQLVPVSPWTLLPMIGAAMLGAWTGAGIVAGLSRYRVRLGMGAALFLAAIIMLLTQLKLIPGGGTALGLGGPALGLAVAANFVLGGLMTLGIGLYAPCMILVSLLGMNPRAAFPIMMGSCAFLMPICSARFVRRGSYHATAAVGLTLGGVPALFIAALLVKAMPVAVVRWIVIAVVLYTSWTLVRAARGERARVPAAPPSAAP
jgi:uncharacterized membrane protein YfcA